MGSSRLGCCSSIDRRRENACDHSRTSELGVHISARLNVLPRIVDRINSEVAALFEAVKHHGPEHVYTDTAEGRAFPVDNNLKYQLIADIDSLLFEINSCAELMGKLFGLLSAHAEESRRTA